MVGIKSKVVKKFANYPVKFNANGQSL
jgi:hypothetical protein